MAANKIKVKFPKPGMGIDEGTIVRWQRHAGDRVVQGEPLVEIETAKAVQDINAPASGTLVEVLIPEGQTAAVNATLAIIEMDIA
jgi:pyruvate/2-oxoglutarate dehydrogenase complex dihydrolipoamide acyltransferase (E2) component